MPISHEEYFTRKMIKQTLVLMAIVLVMVCSGSNGATSSTNCGKPIDPARCRPAWGTKIDRCQDLIKRCRCQHNIALKWVHGGGCKDYPHRPSGCQCSNYCDIPCKEKCLNNGCRWNGKKCLNADGYGGQIGTCTPLPSSSPTYAPTKRPTFEPTPRPTFDPTMLPSLTPTVLPSKAPTRLPTFEPTSLPTFDPTMLPTPTPEYESSPSPSTAPSALPVLTAVPTDQPTRKPTILGEYEYEYEY